MIRIPRTLATAWLTAALALPAFATEMTEAEVRKVDTDTKKLTLKHAEIKSLDMPAMTMVFQVKDPALLAKVKAGDKVRFLAEKQDSGYVVTAIEPAAAR